MRKKGRISDAHDLARQLRSLGDLRAPESLLPAVLARVGLADAYWTIRSPLGPVYVAHSSRGITRVSRAASAAAFEREYRRRFGRPVRRDPSAAPAALRTRIADVARPADGEIRFDPSGLPEFEQAAPRKAPGVPRRPAGP